MTLPAWKPGDPRKVHLIVCCPNCGSDQIHVNGTKKRERHCRCHQCAHRWKDIHDDGVRRVLAV